MNKKEILKLADYLGCNGEELWNELSKMRIISDKDRNSKTKNKFIQYMLRNPDERFWQSVRNFSDYGFVVGTTIPVEDIGKREGIVEDTFYREER